MSLNTQLPRDVRAEPGSDPTVNDGLISVANNAGVVTLTGYVETFAVKTDNAIL